ncbi:Hypothetical predicted protein [Olea europaea subsp. europaea]|uniref:Disease resistance protein n=1 Tax=Olea europaea subsp. europaea TaxID=158383 RepID=A0A8S0QVM7_OLEEU|nr:Hypothetical predicted protein [Olea europaea subsp. europaea]
MALPYQMELLSSLKSLWVENCTSLVEPLPQGNIPSNLTSLAIINCRKLKPPTEWDLHKLTSLYEFVTGNLIEGIPKPHILRHLSISKCPNLGALPMDNQVDNLWSLWIDDCSLIKKCCLKYKGDYWTKIIDTPEVLMMGIPSVNQRQPYLKRFHQVHVAEILSMNKLAVECVCLDSTAAPSYKIRLPMEFAGVYGGFIFCGSGVAVLMVNLPWVCLSLLVGFTMGLPRLSCIVILQEINVTCRCLFALVVRTLALLAEVPCSSPLTSMVVLCLSKKSLHTCRAKRCILTRRARPEVGFLEYGAAVRWGQAL